MSTFTYTALDQSNTYIKGTIKAISHKRAVLRLKKQQLLVINVIRKKTSYLDSLRMISTISRTDKIHLTQHLYTFLEAGIELDRAVMIASEQTFNLKLKEVLSDIYRNVRQGQKLHESFQKYSKYFSSFFINFIKIGEMSGSLDKSLLHLLEQQEKDHDLVTKTRGALIYPFLIITAGIGMIIFMMTFVVPTISNMLKEYGTELPITTKILVALSDFLIANGLFVLFGLLVLFFIFLRSIKTTIGKWYWDKFLLSIPLVKKIVIEFNSARIARSLSAMLKSGVSIDNALEYSVLVSNNSHYQKSINEAIIIVRKGIPLTKVLHGYPKLYSPLIIQMLEIGEQTGKTDVMSEKIASYYEKRIINVLQNLSSTIEPILLLIIGLIIGFVAVSILTPIWKIAETV